MKSYCNFYEISQEEPLHLLQKMNKYELLRTFQSMQHELSEEATHDLVSKKLTFGGLGSQFRELQQSLCYLLKEHTQKICLLLPKKNMTL